MRQESPAWRSSQGRTTCWLLTATTATWTSSAPSGWRGSCASAPISCIASTPSPRRSSPRETRRCCAPGSRARGRADLGPLEPSDRHQVLRLAGLLEQRQELRAHFARLDPERRHPALGRLRVELDRVALELEARDVLVEELADVVLGAPQAG